MANELLKPVSQPMPDATSRPAFWLLRSLWCFFRGHSDLWRVTDEATGKPVYECQRCGYRETISALPFKAHVQPMDTRRRA